MKKPLAEQRMLKCQIRSISESGVELRLKYDRRNGEESFEGDYRISDDIVKYAEMLDVDLDHLFR